MAIHPAVEERLAKLAPDQRAAATAPPGPVLCVAPAGSGKTTTLVARMCWLVATGAQPGRITAVTFNKRAADDLGARMATALEPLGLADEATPRVRTFHALGREILSDAGVSVSNLTDRAEALAAMYGKRLSAGRLRRLDDAFSRLKLDLRADAGAVRESLADGRPEVLAAVGEDERRAFVDYERWLAANGTLDFDDLVGRALRLLIHDDSLLARWRERCSSLLVDEVQDVDRSQLELAVLLAGQRRDIFLVGDDDQTIYAWRLADVRRVLDLAASLPGLRRVDLVTNYRCPRPVVERAVRLVEVNKERFTKQVRARPNAEGALTLAPETGDELARARRLLTEWYGTGDGTYAVLARTKAQLAPYAAVALAGGIPYRAAEDGLLLDHPQVDELLAQLVQSPDLPPSVFCARPGRRRPVAPAMAAWAIGQRDAGQLRAAIASARAARAELRRDDARLNLATVHGTKGLEFDHVACIGMDDGIFPSRRTLEEAADPERALEEERRLAYVAWTRARRSLALVYDPQAPSIFMREAFTDAELGLTAAA